MSFQFSTRSIPSNISKEDEPEHLMRRTDAPNGPSCHTAHELRVLLAQEAENMDPWMLALDDCDVKDADSKDEDI